MSPIGRNIKKRQIFGRPVMLFDGVEPEALTDLGEVHTPSIADLFVAVMSRQPGREQGVVQ